MELITPAYFAAWKSGLRTDLESEFEEIENMELEPHSFTFYTSVSMMSSSKIEGEQLEVDSYVKHKMLSIEYLPDLTSKPDDLCQAYLYAGKNPLTENNFHEAHKLVSSHLLPDLHRGVLRTTEMLVLEHNTGKIQYEAAELSSLQEEYQRLWAEIKDLLDSDLSVEDPFYYAAFIHLVMVNIHPFADGNRRIARLLEK